MMKNLDVFTSNQELISWAVKQGISNHEGVNLKLIELLCEEAKESHKGVDMTPEPTKHKFVS